ncbi:MAG: sulfatase [Planctomycetota bacterium]|jgi:arylsulfatase A-like enzyme
MLVSTLLLSGCRCKSEESAAPDTAQFNLVVIVCDALRAASLPMHGYPRDTAPHLLDLSRESALFNLHLVQYPGTPVSISQLFTGRLMSPLLMSATYAMAPVRAISDDLLILPRALKKAGYRTGIVTSHPWFDRGARVLRFFDHKAVMKVKSHPYAAFQDLAPAVEDFLEGAKRNERPFFLYVHTMDTHVPHRYHPGFDRYRNASGWPTTYNAHDSAVRYTDHWIHQIVKQLRGSGLLDRTVLVVTSDHGEELQEMGLQFWNGGHGYTLRRAQVHVPLLIRLPGDRPRGRRYKGLTRHIDVAPTLLRLTVRGASLAGYRLDGEDLSSELLSGGDGGDADREAVAYTHRYWALFRKDLELHYDQWEDEFYLFKTEPDARNYPRLVPMDAEDLKSSLAERLFRAYRARTEEFLGMPPSHDMLRKARIGIPQTIVHDGTGNLTYEREPDDNKWHARAWMLLESSPGEQPGPITLSTPWASGRYRVRVVLNMRRVREGYKNSFRIHFLDGENAPVELHGSDATDDGQLDAGIQNIGNALKVRISEPHGGVALSGYQLELLGPGARAVEVDEELRERLRALGYVE